MAGSIASSPSVSRPGPHDAGPLAGHWRHEKCGRTVGRKDWTAGLRGATRGCVPATDTVIGGRETVTHAGVGQSSAARAGHVAASQSLSLERLVQLIRLTCGWSISSARSAAQGNAAGSRGWMRDRAGGLGAGPVSLCQRRLPQGPENSCYDRQHGNSSRVLRLAEDCCFSRLSQALRHIRLRSISQYSGVSPALS